MSFATQGALGAFLDPVGITNDPKVPVGSFGPTTRLEIASGSLLDLFLGVIILLSHSVNQLSLPSLHLF